MQGALALVAYFIEECGMPINTVASPLQMTPLHATLNSPLDAAIILPMIRYLVGEGADLTLRTAAGDTAADITRRMNKPHFYAILTSKENEDVLKGPAAASAESLLAERVQAAEAAAQALINELAAEEVAEEARKQAKKAKKAKAKAKSKRAGPTVGVKREPGGNDAEGGTAATGAGLLSMDSLTAAMGGSATGEDEEGEAQESRREEGCPLDGMPPSPPASASSVHNDEDEHEEEDDDKEAFQDFLLDNAPLEYHCPIGICLLTDPINAADGHTYQRAELENWIEMCRVKQQPLTSPMTKEVMAPMYFVNQLSSRMSASLSSDSGRNGWRGGDKRKRGESKEGGGRWGWVVRKGQKKEGGGEINRKVVGPARYRHDGGVQPLKRNGTKSKIYEFRVTLAKSSYSSFSIVLSP
jgi:hypothetical protein